MGRTPLADGPSADSPAGAGAGSAEGVRLRASPSGFRPPPLVPGLCLYRARVILRADGPTRPIQWLPVRGAVPTFPPPEPPLLFPGFPRAVARGVRLLCSACILC
jgi:hypothetical protein